MLVIFVGCSGVGKNTIIGDLIERDPDQFDLLPTYTTRGVREGEYEGHPYYFVSEEQFLSEMDAGMIYEHQRVHDGSLYGGSRRILDEKKKLGKILLKDIDVYGADTLKKVLAPEMRVFSVFLYVKDEEELIDRLRKRGEKEDSIEIRRRRFPLEMELSAHSDYMILNESRERTSEIVYALIAAEKSRTPYRLSAACAQPDEAEVHARQLLLRAGKPVERVELGFDGKGLSIIGGAASYVAALRENAFVQKHVAGMYMAEQDA